MLRSKNPALNIQRLTMQLLSFGIAALGMQVPAQVVHRDQCSRVLPTHNPALYVQCLAVQFLCLGVPAHVIEIDSEVAHRR